MFASQPFAVLPPQSAKPGLQAAIAQPPAEQAPTALGSVQALPQPPQWLALVSRLVSQPFASWPSQFPKPALQVEMAHAPPAQAGVPFCTEQALPQPPQLPTEESRLVSQP